MKVRRFNLTSTIMISQYRVVGNNVEGTKFSIWNGLNHENISRRRKQFKMMRWQKKESVFNHVPSINSCIQKDI